MNIVIPTYGRANRQITARQLERANVPFSLVVQSREKHLYRDYKTVVLPPEIQTLAPTRQWIVENFKGKLCMLDDDLVFFRRRDDEDTKFCDITPAALKQVFAAIEDNLNDYAHVGVSGREGANRKTENFIENTRMMRVLAYDLDVIKGQDIRFDRCQYMLDFDVTLQLLRLGKPNLLINWAVQNQAGSNADGGCAATGRTLESQEADAVTLRDLHPDFVTLVQKETKTWKGMESRTDVRIQWKKAYDYGRSKVS